MLMNDNRNYGNLELLSMLSQLFSKIDSSLKCYVKSQSRNCNINIIDYSVNVMILFIFICSLRIYS